MNNALLLTRLIEVFPESGDEPLAIRWSALNEVFSPREWG